MEAQKVKAVRGTVAIEDKQGKWRIRLPRAVAKDSQRYISTRLDSTPENLKKVQVVAWGIEDDINSGSLDVTLERYAAAFRPSLTVLKPTKVDLGELWEKYSTYRKPQVAATTYIKEYTRKIPNHIKSLPTREIGNAVAIRNHLVATLTPESAKRMLTQLSACCDWAVKSSLIKENLFAGMASEIKLSKKEKEINPFTPAEREAILAAFQQHPVYCHYYSFVRFLFLTGCRTGEAVALQWKHISRDCTQITFCESYDGDLKIRKDTKTHRERKFPCNSSLKELLLSIRPAEVEPTTPVFTTTTGLPIDNHRFTNRVWRGGTFAGKTYKGVVGGLVEAGLVDGYRCPYNTRHTFITMALEAGMTVPQVAKLVGNSPEIILKHYAGSLLKLEVPVF